MWKENRDSWACSALAGCSVFVSALELFPRLLKMRAMSLHKPGLLQVVNLQDTKKMQFVFPQSK